MEKLIIGIMVVFGFICIIFPKNISELISELSWFSAKQSASRTSIVRLMGVSIIVLAVFMFKAFAVVNE